MQKIGPQNIQPLCETEYTLISLTGNEAILFNTISRKYETWVLNNNYAGYVIEINGKGYEFVSES